MARYLGYSRNLQNVKFSSRLFTTKLEQQRITEDITQEIVEEEKPIAPAIRYNVCRDRTTSGHQKYQFPKTAADEDQKKGDSVDQLSSSQMELQRAICASTTESSSQLVPAAGYRQFEASSTYKNLVLPLKSSKLADPFPSPVKMMPSHTVSDQEKADQMLAERRIPRSINRKKI